MKRKITMKLINMSWQYDTRCSTFVYTPNAMKHLNSRMLNLQLLIKDYTTIIIQGKWQQGKMGREEKEGEGGIPILTKLNHEKL